MMQCSGIASVLEVHTYTYKHVCSRSTYKVRNLWMYTEIFQRNNFSPASNMELGDHN